MCSIAGKINLESDLREEKGTFVRIQNTLLRRGPDDKGMSCEKHASLIHTRLAVVDIENGKQPMEIEHYIIVYNGELYNTEEIRAELKSSGFTFRGHSDTEVLLKSYIKWKEKCVEKFNGIFAFAIWDKKEEKLFIARDRIGVKPFFYYNRKGNFIFASEIKGILASGAVEAEADINSIAELMLLGPGRTQGQGVFRNIEELPPATCGYYDENGLRTWKYWSLEDKEHTDDLKTTIEKVRFLVTDSIERQLVSDVPVCTFLSGGLDSSIITSVADQYFHKKGENLHTFSLDYKDNDIYFKESKFQPNSDPSFINIMNNYLHAENHLVKLDTDELASALYDAVDARDLPGMADVDSSLLLFCKEIKKQGTVALSGECADEIFGGYPWYRDKTIREKEGFPWAQSTSYRYKFLKPEFAKQINPQEFIDSRYKATISLADTGKTKSALNKRMKEMMKLNLDWFMQTLLDRKDRMSMYNGLEVRVPFCDYRIAEYLYNVPWEYKDYNHYEKGLLRKAMEDYLPEEVLWRKKSPYPKTHNPSYLKKVSEMLTEIINDSASPLLQIVKKNELQKLLTENLSQPWYGQLMTTPQTIAYFVQFDYWLRKYKVRII